MPLSRVKEWPYDLETHQRAGRLTSGTTSDSVRVALSDLVHNAETDTLLDVACGNGEFAELVVESVPRIGRLYGVDPAVEELREARRYFTAAHPGVRSRFRTGRAESLPFADDSFRLVSFSNALHHVEDPERSLLEIARVLEPGGAVIIQEMRSDDLPADQRNGRDLHHIKADIDVALGHNHRHTFSLEQTTEFIERSGLQIEEVREYNPEGGVHPPDEQIDERIEFLIDYLEPLSGSDAYARIKRKVMKLSTALRQNGFAPARQVLFRATAPNR